MLKRKKAVTLKDIARRAGVSHPAVSQALSGSSKGTIKVSEETRSRVRQIALEMGYRPSAVARMLRSGRSGLIGVVQHNVIDSIATRRFMGALDAIGKTEFRPFIHHIDSQFEDSIAGMADALLSSSVEAVLCLHPPQEVGQNQIDTLIDAGLPVAVIGESWIQGASVFVDERVKAYQAIGRHVLDLGARNITLLSSGPDLSRNPSAKKLWDGFVNAVSESGLAIESGPETDGRCNPLQTDLLLVSDEEIEAAIRKFPDIFPLYIPGYIGMLKMIERGNLPEAVICQVDAYALGAMRACSEHGIRVPQDIALAGFGNEPAASAGLAPLTTADHPIAEISRLAVEDIQLKLKGVRSTQGLTSLTQVPCHFIPRLSTTGKQFAETSSPQAQSRQSKKT